MRGGLQKPSRKVTHSFQRLASNHDLNREIRAKATPKHPNIQRFGIPKAPAKPTAKVHTVHGEIISGGRPQPQANQVAAPMPSMITSVSHQRLERMLDQALTHADTHKEALRYAAAKHFWHRRWFSGVRRWIAVGLVLAVAAGALLVLWQRVPQLSLKTAGMQAHLTPTVPTYQPDGFKLAGPAKAVSGTVDIRYVSESNPDHTYNIVQSQSNLTSQMVGQNIVPKGSAVQTSQVDGNTVYIYGQDNDAAWVNNGILYTIKDRANLNSDTLIKIVEGLKP
jgi:hypothetical protein